MIGRVTDGSNGDTLAGVTLVVTFRTEKYETTISDERGCFVLPSENVETLTAYYLDVTKVFSIEPPNDRVTVKDIELVAP